MTESKFLMALLLAIAPAIVISLIEGIGEWSNSRNYKKSKALDAIYWFRYNIENKMNRPDINYYKNMSELTNHQLQLMVMYLNQWSVYMNNHVASRKIIKNGVGYELTLCLILLLPTASKLKKNYDLQGYFDLMKRYHIYNLQWYN